MTDVPTTPLLLRERAEYAAVLAVLRVQQADLDAIVADANAHGMRVGRCVIGQQSNGLWCVHEQQPNGNWKRVTVKGQETPERAKHDAIARLLA